MSNTNTNAPTPTSTNTNATVSLDDIQEQITKLGEMLNARYKQLVEDEKKIAHEKETFDEAHRVVSTFKDPIKLNIGGKIFMTSKTTLLKEESMLSAMFSGRHELEKGEDGAYFIDRDSKHFGKILNFLRDGEFEMRNDEVERKEILREAEFYSLSGLIEYLKPVVVALDPVRKGPNITINGTTASNTNGGSYQPVCTSTFSSGVHSCEFAWTGLCIMLAGVVGANSISTTSAAYTQAYSMMLGYGGPLYIAGGNTKSLSPYSSPIAMELDCDKRTITWIIGTARYTEPLHINLQAPFSFCIDLNQSSSATLTQLT